MQIKVSCKDKLHCCKDSNFSQEHVFPYCSLVVESGNTNPADFLLACITRGVCDAYQNVILNIPRLSTNSTKQLITDIGMTAFKKMIFTTLCNLGSSEQHTLAISWRT